MSDFQPFVEDAVDIFGVAIRAHVARVEQRHVGVVYRDDENRVRFLHLAAHDDLRYGPCDASFHCVEVGFDPINKKMLAWLAQDISKKHVGHPMPYGFEYEGGIGAPIDSEGEWTEVMSMTCSTFVLCLFAAQGYPLIDVSTWPKRDSDREWARSMLIDYLVTVYESQADIDRLQSIMPTYRRVRPEETAVAAKGLAASRPRPYPFAEVEPPSLELVARLIEHVSKSRGGLRVSDAEATRDTVEQS